MGQATMGGGVQQSVLRLVAILAEASEDAIHGHFMPLAGKARHILHHDSSRLELRDEVQAVIHK